MFIEFFDLPYDNFIRRNDNLMRDAINNNLEADFIDIPRPERPRRQGTRGLADMPAVGLTVQGPRDEDNEERNLNGPPPNHVRMYKVYLNPAMISSIQRCVEENNWSNNLYVINTPRTQHTIFCEDIKGLMQKIKAQAGRPVNFR